MTLVSFRLFRKHLGNLREFFGQMVDRPPGKKLPVRLCFEFYRGKDTRWLWVGGGGGGGMAHTVEPL